jgi:hypothetical protein
MLAQVKRRHRYVFSFLLVLIIAVGVYADCVPTYEQTLLWLDSCDLQENPSRSILKRVRSYITWPDNVSDYVDADGAGCCHDYAAVGSYPDFLTPVTSETRWEQRVRCYRCYYAGPGDPLLSTIDHTHLYWAEHECPGGGGGCEGGGCQGGQQMPECDPPDQGSFECCCCVNSSGQCTSSPILIDTLGDGFSLTDAGGGVNFDVNKNGAAEKTAWTIQDSDDAWLALDRNGNGLIDDGAELFGNYTPQIQPPTGVQKNGFLALAEYDKRSNGGNADGQINRDDTVFNSLRLWRDTNHNGISEPNELHGLLSLGLEIIDLDYKESRKRDEHGNRFRYRAKVRDTQHLKVGRWAWDVFLTSQ